MTHWTPADVEARLSEAGMILRRLPEPRRNGYFSTWPEIVHGFADKVGQEPKPMRVSPSPRDIARMSKSCTTLIADRRPMPPVDFAKAPRRCSRMSK